MADIFRANPQQLDDYTKDLSDILFSCVEAGASISFVQPFTRAEARLFWTQKIYPRVRAGTMLLLLAKKEDRIVGSVLLDQDLPPNQAHRGEVAKLLVHPVFRKRGIATALMEELESEAISIGKSLITLDTRTNDNAEPLYIMLGYQIAGRIPNFAKAPDCDRLDSTTYMYKIIA